MQISNTLNWDGDKPQKTKRKHRHGRGITFAVVKVSNGVNVMDQARVTLAEAEQWARDNGGAVMTTAEAQSITGGL
jgi:hypothetical protein